MRYIIFQINEPVKVRMLIRRKKIAYPGIGLSGRATGAARSDFVRQEKGSPATDYASASIFLSPARKRWCSRSQTFRMATSQRPATSESVKVLLLASIFR